MNLRASGRELASAAPVHAQQLLGVVFAELGLALIGLVQRIAEVARQLDAGGDDEGAVAVVLDGRTRVSTRSAGPGLAVVA